MNIRGKTALVTGGAVRVGQGHQPDVGPTGRQRGDQLSLVGRRGGTYGRRGPGLRRRRGRHPGRRRGSGRRPTSRRRDHRTLRRGRYRRQQRQPLRQDAHPDGRPRNLAAGDAHLHRRRVLRGQQPRAQHARPRRRGDRQHRRSLGLDAVARLHGPRRRQGRPAGAYPAVGAGAGAGHPRERSHAGTRAAAAGLQPGPRRRRCPTRRCWNAGASRRMWPWPCATSSRRTTSPARSSPWTAGSASPSTSTTIRPCEQPD